MKDRLTQLVAFVLLLGGMGGAFLLTAGINQTRIDQKLTYTAEAGDDANPVYTFASMFGPVRGFMVNLLWQRSEELKREGKFFEANNLAEMITTLQPRYPEAWNFQGWNMAYNISVKTKTKEERWDWVKKGMDLIRDRGIPNNPNAVVLYRSLAWILGHKMTGQTDDMHWYYKQQFAEYWQTLLGEPSRRWMAKDEFRGLVGQKDVKLDPYIHGKWVATEQMRLIADFAQKYLRRPNRTEGDFNASNYFSTLNPEALKQFYEDYPGTQEFVTELRAVPGYDGQPAGFGLNPRTLRAIGRLLLFTNAGYRLFNSAIFNRETLGEDGFLLAQWARQRGSTNFNINPLLTMLRALTLVADYHMDPAFMLQCMEEYGPMDWRHPAAHACYWTRLGTIRAGNWVTNKDRVDLVNANRSTIHALQHLSHYGKIRFRPAVKGQTEVTINHEPDTRMIPAYNRAWADAVEKVESGAYGENAKAKTYYNGHENFLQAAVVLYYFEGRHDIARNYFEECKKRYGDYEPSPARQAGHYQLELLEDFVVERMLDDLRFQTVKLIENWIRLAYEQGTASGSKASKAGSLRSSYLDAARNAYNKFREDSQTEKRNDPNLPAGRQDIPESFEQLVLNYLVEQMIGSDHYTLAHKRRIWVIANTNYRAKDEKDNVRLFRAYNEMVSNLVKQFDREIPQQDQEQNRKLAEARVKEIAKKNGLTPAQQEAEVKRQLDSIYQRQIVSLFPPPVGYPQWVQRMQQQQQPVR